MSQFTEERFIGITFLMERYNKSRPTINRWIRAGKLPEPDYLNGRPVWRQSALIAAEAPGGRLFESGSRHNIPA